MDWCYLERVLAADSEAILWRESERFARDHGFDRYSYVRRRAHADRETRLYTRHNYSGDYWQQRFARLNQDDVERSDPVAMHVASMQPPTAWNCRGQVVATRPDIEIAAQDILLNGIRDMGIRAGITIPLMMRDGWGYMGFTTVDTARTVDLLPLIAATHTFAHFVQGALRRLAGRPVTPALTPREREVLRWAALGKSSWEISRILSISERTVHFHVAGATRRLGVSGRRAGVARALALGLIEL